jgi:HSP20 family molecular chaperone IbpA
MLPEIVDRQHIRADFRDGVLLVHLPKVEQKVVAPRKIAIS